MFRPVMFSLATLSLVVSGASVADAGCGGGSRYGGGYNRYNNYRYTKVYHRPTVVRHVPAPVVVHRPVDPCYHPAHRYVFVRPGDTWATICLREYGRVDVWQQVARYNKFAIGAPLPTAGRLLLPSIYQNGRVVASTAPAPVAPAIAAPAPVAAPALAAPAAPAFPAPAAAPVAPQLPVAQPRVAQPTVQQPAVQPAPVAQRPIQQPMMQQTSMQQPAAPQRTVPANPLSMRTAPVNNAPSFAVGSAIELDGQSFGGNPGQVRLTIGVMALPVKIIDWNANKLRIELPMLELAGTADAMIEIIDADGKSLVKSPLRITPGGNRLASNN